MKDPAVDPKTDSLPLDIYGDPQRIMTIFNRFILMIMLGFGAGIIFELSIGNIYAATLLGISVLPVMASLYFIRRKNFEMTATLLAIILLSLITAVATAGLGIRQISISAYPAVLIVASLVVRKRIMVFITLYNIACAAWLFFGEIYGIYTPGIPSSASGGEFLILILILVFTSFMVRLLTETLFQNNLRLQKELQERKQIETQREALIGELEARNAELVQFTYTVSHDLRSPLVTIKGFLGYLEEHAKAGRLARLQDDLGRIARAVDKMSSLLNDLLELSRIGRLMNPPEIVTFPELVREAVKPLQAQLDEKNIALKLDQNLPAVFGDKQRLIEVLQNLLDNALKFMGEQEQPQIDIGRRGEEQGKPVFFVRDNGIGIPPEYHERVFGLFNRLNPEIDGTGVGLALVRRIVEFHQGRIWVESKAGQGAIFYFTLPQG